MSTEISAEAKLASPNGAMIRARHRLIRDGSQSDAAFKRRVLLVAAERNLPPAEYAKLMHKRVLTQPIMTFCKKHDVSMDWLMDGSLQGLQAHEAGGKKQGMTPDERRPEFIRLLLLLPLEMQQIAIHRLRAR